MIAWTTFLLTEFAKKSLEQLQQLHLFCHISICLLLQFNKWRLWGEPAPCGLSALHITSKCNWLQITVWPQIDWPQTTVWEPLFWVSSLLRSLSFWLVCLSILCRWFSRNQNIISLDSNQRLHTGLLGWNYWIFKCTRNTVNLIRVFFLYWIYRLHELYSGVNKNV